MISMNKTWEAAERNGFRGYFYFPTLDAQLQLPEYSRQAISEKINWLYNNVGFIRAVVDGMIARRFGRIVNITSTSVKAPIPILGLSNGARAGLTGFIAGIARETVQHNVTINNLLPGPFDTDRLRGLFEATAKKTGKPVDVVRQERMDANPAKRFGTAAEFGDACAYLCSAQAGFITGQNMVLDGGAYPGTF